MDLIKEIEQCAAKATSVIHNPTIVETLRRIDLATEAAKQRATEVRLEDLSDHEREKQETLVLTAYCKNLIGIIIQGTTQMMFDSLNADKNHEGHKEALGELVRKAQAGYQTGGVVTPTAIPPTKACGRHSHPWDDRVNPN